MDFKIAMLDELSYNFIEEIILTRNLDYSIFIQENVLWFQISENKTRLS